METDFEDAVLRRISALERQAHHTIKAGAITDVDVKKGLRIQWGPEKDFKSPWVRPSRHSGYVTENHPWKVGQTVISIGMDPEHRTALIFPHSPSDANPADKDASMTAHTYRVRDPNGQDGQPSKDDDDNDYRHTRDYLRHETNLGSKLSRSARRDTKNTGLKINDQVATDNQDGKFNSRSIDAKQVLSQFASGFVSHFLDAKQFFAKAGENLHSFFVHSEKGVRASANNGQHTTTWLNGILHASTTQITHDAPITNINRILKVFNISQLIGGISTGAFEVGPDIDGAPGAATISGAISVTGLAGYADDAAAAVGGVPVNGIYINESTGALTVRRT